MLRPLLLLAVIAQGATDPPWPASLPSLRLADPLGAVFTDAHFTSRGVIVVATAPTAAQGGAQEAWNTAFDAFPFSAQTPTFVLLEDLSQSWFRGVVLSRMKEKYRAGGSPVLLLDESGSVRRALGVAENATVAFAFGPGGKLLAVEREPGTKERAERLWRLVRGETK